MFSSYSAPSNPTAASRRGFSLVELLISISIIAIVAAIILTRQNAYNGAILLRSQAYEIALSLRDVQLSAVSAQSDGGGDFREILGVHFDAADTQNTSFIIFRDDGDGFYEASDDTILQNATLDPRFEIRTVTATGSPESISNNAVSVVFERPNFDARFFDSTGELTQSNIEIEIARRDATGNGSGDVRIVEVTSTGQISVQ